MGLVRLMRTKINTCFSLRKVKKHGKNTRVNKKSVFNNNTFLGNNCNFNGMHIYGTGKVTIGDNFHSGEKCVMITSNHNYNGEKIPYDETYVSKNIIIEDNVWIGYGVMILGGSHIKEGAIIQAGSVVCGTIEKCAIAGGSPARVFKYRDIEKYEDLKAKEMFF